MEFSRKAAFLLITLFLFMPTFPLIDAKQTKSLSASSTEKVSISLHFTDAYYADLDGDGYSDDVFGGVDLFISGSERVSFDYYITLVLPSGKSFTYAYRISTRYTYLHLANYFYDHVSESGDYTFIVEIVTRTGGLQYDPYHHVFDPPGGVPTDPTYSLVTSGSF
ncbi:MAG: hypothetical protein D6732_15585 [Methanobacteriota archaeon]|nr:MAG: hypothetical protein D6732_15585 [Euryarchaeota archaeon]